MRRGDVFLADISPRSGSEQRGTRPVVLVSHDAFNEARGWRSLIVVPLTKRHRTGPTFVRLTAGTAGLNADSVALCHQVTTLDRAKFVNRLGALPPEDMARVDEGLRAALSLL